MGSWCTPRAALRAPGDLAGRGCHPGRLREGLAFAFAFYLVTGRAETHCTAHAGGRVSIIAAWVADDRRLRVLANSRPPALVKVGVPPLAEHLFYCTRLIRSHDGGARRLRRRGDRGSPSMATEERDALWRSSYTCTSSSVLPPTDDER